MTMEPEIFSRRGNNNQHTLETKKNEGEGKEK